MKKYFAFENYCLIVFTAISTLLMSKAMAQDSLINLDEAKVPPYKLPDVLKATNGKLITTSKEWTEQQRPHMLELFADNVYGKFPGKPKQMHFRVNSIDSSALGGKAIRKQVTIFFTSASTAPSMELLLYLPRSVKTPVAVFTGLNFSGNQSVSSDPGIILSTRWIQNNEENGIVNNHATEASRGKDTKWPVEEIINRGYALATAYYGDLEPDNPEGWKTAVRSLLKSELGINEQDWGAIGAWAWGLSRIMDYLETDTAVNSREIIITGHSRLGKAALWAAANDTRFAIVVSNNSGEGGAALSRRWYGETIERINGSFPHWFSPHYKQFNAKPQLLPVDQHILLALMAPRPLYVASAVEDQWADPLGEFLSAKNAEPVYALFGKKGIGKSELPPVNQPVGETIRYHIRTGKHDMTLYDWQQYINFADTQFRSKH